MRPQPDSGLVGQVGWSVGTTEEITMEFTLSKIIEGPVDQVWQTVAHEFADISTWSSAVAASTAAEVVPLEGVPVGGRVCSVPGFGDLTETITSYSEADTSLGFEVTGMPSFVTLARNNLQVRPLGANRSEVTAQIRMETNVIGKAMGPMFALKLKKTLRTLLDELAEYVENGSVSRKKAKQLAKAAA
jgi:hypothetical protein